MADGEIQIFKDKQGKHRWRFESSNGKIIADSGEGYETAAGARRAAENLKKRAPTAKIVPAKPASKPKPGGTRSARSSGSTAKSKPAAKNPTRAPAKRKSSPTRSSPRKKSR